MTQKVVVHLKDVRRTSDIRPSEKVCFEQTRIKLASDASLDGHSKLIWITKPLQTCYNDDPESIILEQC